MPDENETLSSYLQKRLQLLGVVSAELAAGCDAIRRLDLDRIHLHVFHLELLCGQVRGIDRQIRGLLPSVARTQPRQAIAERPAAPHDKDAAHLSSQSESAASIAELMLANAALQSEVRAQNNVFAGTLNGTRKTFAALARVFDMQQATYARPRMNSAARTQTAGS